MIFGTIFITSTKYLFNIDFNTAESHFLRCTKVILTVNQVYFICSISHLPCDMCTAALQK
jgi:hypothetical protein